MVIVTVSQYADSTDLYTFLCPDALSVDSGTGNGNPTRRKEVGMLELLHGSSLPANSSTSLPLATYPHHTHHTQMLPIQTH